MKKTKTATKTKTKKNAAPPLIVRAGALTPFTKFIGPATRRVMYRIRGNKFIRVYPSQTEYPTGFILAVTVDGGFLYTVGHDELVEVVL